MNDNMKVYQQVRAVPQDALKAINGGRLKGMSDINPMWRLKMLTELFGICGIGWKIEITDKRLENGAAGEIVCFVDINLYVKVDGEWSAPIPGMGGSSFVTMERSGNPYTSDECFKMAYTDAISVACKSLGFAADVYYANDRTKYSAQPEEQQPAQSSQGSYSRPTVVPDNNTNQQPQQPVQPPAASNNSVLSDKPTDKQLKYIFVVAGKKNMSNDQLKELMKDKFKVESTKELTRSQFKQLLDYLESA